MKKVKYNRASGNSIWNDPVAWANQNGQAIADWANQNPQGGNTGNKKNSSGILNGIFNNVGGWLDSIGQTIVGVTAARNPVTVEDNTPKVLAIAGVGVAAVTLIIALLIIFKN